MEDDPGDRWAGWLREQFDRHPTIRTNADLVRAGGVKDNGRPVIDASTVTQWLRGRRPSFQLALAAADAFGVDRVDVLMVAGYDVPGWEGRMVVLHGETEVESEVAPALSLEDVPDEELVAEVLRRLKGATGGHTAAIGAGRRPLSVAPATVSDAIAAHEEEGSIAGEQEESDTP